MTGLSDTPEDPADLTHLQGSELSLWASMTAAMSAWSYERAAGCGAGGRRHARRPTA